MIVGVPTEHRPSSLRPVGGCLGMLGDDHGCSNQAQTELIASRQGATSPSVDVHCGPPVFMSVSSLWVI